MKCKNCKYYSPITSKSHGVLPYGECSILDKDYNNLLNLNTTVEGYDLDLSDNNNNIRTLMEEGWSQLDVGENFGCIHFKDKNND